MSEANKSSGGATCPGCGAGLPPKAPEGLCPRCLLGGALPFLGVESEPAVDDDPLGSLLEGRQVADYEIIKLIARGGMGAVFRARQKHPERTVALKVIAAGELATRRMVERFRTEGEAAARLDHPNIVPIYEVGHEAGWHFFSMRLIEGGTLGDAIAAGAHRTTPGGHEPGARGDSPYPPAHTPGLPPREAARLLIKIARAVHHAHERGVLHRDLKPGNILLDAHGEPHLTDFGLAKMIESSVELTLSNVALGTPAYMAPEQASRSTRDITVSADVYGLGAVFYEMLTGRPPFQSPSTHALLRMVAEDEPMPPSLVLGARRKSALIKTAKAPPDKQRLVEQIPASTGATHALLADLDAICLKCLEKEPALRYRSAEALAEDLERAVRGEPISARPSTATQRVRKWVRRNPAKVAAIASFTSLLLAGTAISTWLAIRASRAKLAETELRRQAEAQAYAADINLAQQTLAQNNVGRARDLLLRYQSPRAKRPPFAGSKNAAEFQLGGKAGRSTPGGSERSPEDLRGWEWRYLHQQARSDADSVFTNVTHSITSLSVSSDERWLAVGQTDGGGLIVFDRQSRAEVLRVESPFQRVMTAFSPREPLLVFTSTSGPSRAERRHSLRFWNAATGQVVRDILVPGSCERIQFSADGQTVLAAIIGPPNALMLWRVADGELLANRPSESVNGGFIHAAEDLSFAAEAVNSERLRLTDLRTGKVAWTIQAADEQVTAIALSPDRTIAAIGAGFADSSIRLYAVDTGRELGRLDGHSGYVEHLSFLPNGKTLISASSDQTLRLWSVEERRSVGLLRGHRQEVWCHVLLPDQRTLVSGAKDGAILVWDIERARRQRGRLTLPVLARGWVFQPDSQAVLLGETAGILSEWTGPEFQQRRVLHDFGTNITRACFTPDAARVAVELAGRRGIVWDIREKRLVAEFALPPGRSWVDELDPSGTRVYLDNNPDEDFYEWDVTSNRLAQTWRVPGPYAVDSAPSSDRRWRISLNSKGGGIARDLVAQTSLPFSISITEPDAVALSPDNRLFAIASLRGYVHLWEWPSLREIGKLQGFLQGAHSVSFSPDGKRVAAGSNGRQAVKLWDVGTQRELVTLDGEGSIFSRICFSPDGNMIGARSFAGIVHIWRAPSLAEIEAEAR